MNAEDSVLDYGFLNLIRTFEKLKPDLYDWVAAGYDETIVAPPATSEMQQELSQPIPVDGVTEIQHVDIMVTQQWLQAMMWKLSMMIPGSDRNRVHTLLPFHLPVLVGKTLLDFLGSVSQGAIDAHGIGMVRGDLLTGAGNFQSNCFFFLLLRNKNCMTWARPSQT